MSFEPTKVIEMRDGKQIGQTMIQTAEGIPYDNTDSGLTAGNVQDAVDELSSDLSNVLKLHEIRALSTWTIGSTYTISQEDWDKYTEFHVYVSHANVSIPSYYEIVFNKDFFSYIRLVGYGSGYVQMTGDSDSRTLTLKAALANNANYNPLIAVFAR